MMHRDFLDAGLRVFPLWPISGTECGCGDPDCAAAGKHPRASNWQHSPHWSDDQLDIMEEMGQFATGYGVLVRVLLCVDVDERNGGAESFERLCADLPGLAEHCGLVVKTGSGGRSRHLYYRLPESVALVQALAAYPGIDFKSSGYVVGPGSLHASGGRYEVIVGAPDEITVAPPRLVNLLRKPERHRAEVDGGAVDVSDDDLRDMLSCVPNDSGTDYEQWIRVGMGLHQTTGGSAEGLEMWGEWSASNADGKHDPRKMDQKWHSFGKSADPVTFGTLAHYAELGGWVAPVTFTSDVHIDAPRSTSEGIDISGVDLLRPPGLTGRVVEWLNARARYSRETLAVGVALAAVSAAGGMRYEDPLDGITPNMFLFGVSGSGTGKEGMLKAYQELMRAAGLSSAVHGGIKSEQEIYRNLTRHQAALYAIDELGEVLSKMQNARAKGTTAYLEGVIGTLMSLYSKADSFALVTGDLKEEIRKQIQGEYASVQKRVDDTAEPKDADLLRLESLTRQMDMIDQGIERPFLAVFGLTTPERFDALMDFDMATSGMLGRTLIFRERDDNPVSRPRDKIKRGPVPDDIVASLQQLYAPGYSDVPHRVERIGDVVSIPTRPDAEVMLGEVDKIFWQMAEDCKESNGLTAIVRRGYEQTAKISIVLAMPSGLRTPEHVRYAFALAHQDIQGKLRLATANSATDKADALVSMILALVTEEHGETQGRIRNKCRKYRKADVDTCLDKLVESGHLRTEKSTGKGRPSIKFYATRLQS